MAGAFGFEADKYEVSVQCGERALLPAVREAAEGTLVIADGFSCREQIMQFAGRHPLHFAEVVQLALRNGASSAQPRFEGEPAPHARLKPLEFTLLGGAAAAMLAMAGWLLRRR